MEETLRLKTLHKFKSDKLFNKIEAHMVEWIKNNRCGCYKGFEGKRKDYILNHSKICNHLVTDRINKMGKETDKLFNDCIRLGIMELKRDLEG